MPVDDPERTLGSDARGEGRGGLAQGRLVSLAPRRLKTTALRRDGRSAKPEQYLTREQQKVCLDSAAIRIDPRNYPTAVVELTADVADIHAGQQARER